jgi:hypothetical protein
MGRRNKLTIMKKSFLSNIFIIITIFPLNWVPEASSEESGKDGIPYAGTGMGSVLPIVTPVCSVCIDGYS